MSVIGVYLVAFDTQSKIASKSNESTSNIGSSRPINNKKSDSDDSSDKKKQQQRRLDPFAIVVIILLVSLNCY